MKINHINLPLDRKELKNMSRIWTILSRCPSHEVPQRIIKSKFNFTVNGLHQQFDDSKLQEETLKISKILPTQGPSHQKYSSQTINKRRARSSLERTRQICRRNINIDIPYNIQNLGGKSWTPDIHPLKRRNLTHLSALSQNSQLREVHGSHFLNTQSDIYKK